MKQNWNLNYTYEEQLSAAVKRTDSGASIHLGENVFNFRLIGESDGVLKLESESGKRYEVRLGTETLSYGALDIKLAPEDQGRRKKSAAHAGGLTSPMPGKIFKVLVQPGDTVEAGKVLLILEAMKMEHSIKAPHAGVVKEIFFKEGDLVDGAVELATLESSATKE